MENSILCNIFFNTENKSVPYWNEHILIPEHIDINALKHEIEQALNANISDENRYTDALNAAVKKLNTYYIDAHSVMENMPQITAIKNILI